MSEHVHHHAGDRPPRNWSSINQWLLWIGLAAAVAWLFWRHNTHLVQLLPFLLILACPLMHLFGHGGHGGHGRRGGEKAPEGEAPSDAADPSGGQGKGHMH